MVNNPRIEVIVHWPDGGKSTAGATIKAEPEIIEVKIDELIKNLEPVLHEEYFEGEELTVKEGLVSLYSKFGEADNIGGLGTRTGINEFERFINWLRRK